MNEIDDLSMQEFEAYVEGIGPHSALSRSLDPDSWVWSTEKELLAKLIEVVDRLTYYTVNIGTEGKTKLRPLEIRRPSIKRQGTTYGEFRRMVRRKDAPGRIQVSKKKAR